MCNNNNNNNNSNIERYNKGFSTILCTNWKCVTAFYYNYPSRLHFRYFWVSRTFLLTEISYFHNLFNHIYSSERLKKSSVYPSQNQSIFFSFSFHHQENMIERLFKLNLRWNSSAYLTWSNSKFQQRRLTLIEFTPNEDFICHTFSDHHFPFFPLIYGHVNIFDFFASVEKYELSRCNHKYLADKYKPSRLLMKLCWKYFVRTGVRDRKNIR